MWQQTIWDLGIHRPLAKIKENVYGAGTGEQETKRYEHIKKQNLGLQNIRERPFE